MDELQQLENAGAQLAGTDETESGAAELRRVIDTFLRELWRENANRGIWQVVHSLEGALPLLLALEGVDALITIAHAARSITTTAER
ncbi:MAG: hypothetical protein R2867_01800 [Caldilineaceae bacterium]